MVDHVLPSSLASNYPPATARQGLLARQVKPDDAALRSTSEPTAGERWETFEAEFGLSNTNPSLLLGSIQNAKYQLDRATFAIQEFTRSVEATLRFDYGIADLVGMPPRRPGRPLMTGNIFQDSFEQVRFKSDIRLNAIGESFIGVKLEMPIGN
jgi:hypothetical protein